MGTNPCKKFSTTNEAKKAIIKTKAEFDISGSSQLRKQKKENAFRAPATTQPSTGDRFLFCG